MTSTLRNRAFLRISAARVAVVGVVATGAAVGLTACGNGEDSNPAPVETTTVTSTEKAGDNSDDRDDRDGDDRDDDDDRDGDGDDDDRDDRDDDDDRVSN